MYFSVCMRKKSSLHCTQVFPEGEDEQEHCETDVSHAAY